MKIRKLMWVVPFLALCSCSVNNNKKDNKISDEQAYEMLEEALQEVPIIEEEYDEPLTPLPLKDAVENDSTASLVKFHEGDRNQYVIIEDKSIEDVKAPYVSIGDYNPTYKDVTLVDENDNEVATQIIRSDNGQSEFLIPVSSFEERHGYHLKLLNDNVRFAGKDDSIRQITYYSLDVNDDNRVNLATKYDNIKSFDINKVSYFDVDALGAYFIYNEVFDIDPNVVDETGMKFRIANLDKEEDDDDTLYGKLVSNQKNPNGAGYVIRYEACKGEDLYSALNVNDEIVVDENNCHITLEQGDEEESMALRFGKNFLAHPDIVSAMSGLMDHYDVKPENYLSSAMEWITSLSVKFNLNYDSSNNTFTWGVKASLQFYPESEICITLHFEYKQTIRYTVSASLSIETWFFIPTGVNYKLEVKEDDTKEVTFGIIIQTNMAPYDEEAIKKGIKDDIATAMTKNNDIKSKFKGDSPTTSADGKSYPLFRFDCYYFFPLDIRFEIDFYWKMQLTLDALVKYTSHTQKVDVSIANSNGCDPHSETKTVTDRSLTFQFIGTFHAEIGLKASLGIGISGFYRFFHAEVYIAAYGAIDAQGFLVMGVAWNESQEAVLTGACGGKFEVSVGVKWGVDIVLLFGGFNFEWPIAKAVLLGFADDCVINSFISEQATVEITDEDYGKTIDLDNYHLLGVNVFDPKNLTPTTRDMKHNEAALIGYGAFAKEEKKENYFSVSLVSGSQYIDFNDYKISIKKISGIVSFTAQVKVTVNSSHSFTSDGSQDLVKIINIHFTNNRKQEVSTLDYNQKIETIGSYVIGTSIKLPVPNAPRYQRFIGWKNLTTGQVINYNEDDPNTGTYNVPDTTNPVTFEYLYEDYYSWRVVWMDGLGNIIKTDEVLNNEAASEPTEEERDQYMISWDPNYKYEFVGYDTDYSHITANTVIRAMYELRRA